MHPAFLSQAKEAHSRTTVPDLDKWSTYFGDNPQQEGTTEGEAEKLGEAHKFYNELVVDDRMFLDNLPRSSTPRPESQQLDDDTERRRCKAATAHAQD